MYLSFSQVDTSFYFFFFIKNKFSETTLRKLNKSRLYFVTGLFHRKIKLRLTAKVAKLAQGTLSFLLRSWQNSLRSLRLIKEK